MYKQRVVAVIPTRKGSQRVKSKNTRTFVDTTLLDLKLKVLKYVKGIDEIIVNTDCPISIEIAEKHGVKIYKRDDYYASSDVTNNIHWKHIAEVTDADILLLAQATSPLIKVKTYEDAIEDFLNADDNIDSINSVSLEKKFLWQNNMALNYNSEITPKSQDLPDIVSLNFAITIISKNNMFNNENVVGKKPKFIILDKIESIDIDDMLDFEFAEFMYSKLGFDYFLQ